MDKNNLNPPNYPKITEDEISDFLVEGTILILWFNPNNPNNRSYEIRAVVDNNFIVTRTYSETKKEFVYEINTAYYWRQAASMGKVYCKYCP